MSQRRGHGKVEPDGGASPVLLGAETNQAGGGASFPDADATRGIDTATSPGEATRHGGAAASHADAPHAAEENAARTSGGHVRSRPPRTSCSSRSGSQGRPSDQDGLAVSIPSAPPGEILTRFPHPEPPRGPRTSVLPVFLPFAGCPGRCVFCDQRAQTGQAPEPLPVIHERLAQTLAALTASDARTKPAPELAFYGGTFTALPEPWPRRFLELARPLVESGRLSRVRCSTRPDAVDARKLAELRGLGLSLVELGVQSFDDAALTASRRGYAGATARRACAVVRESGLALGVQLMPGMPGQSAVAFRRDAAIAADLAPELARLYPCLVLAGTELAELWRAGAYAPWPLDATLDALADALPVLWRAGVRVARMGLAEQAGLAVLAGPRHPALGQMARARTLLRIVTLKTTQLPEPADTLLLPRRLQGEALGQRRALAAGYAALGLTVRFWGGPDIVLCATGGGPGGEPRGPGLCSAREIC